MSTSDLLRDDVSHATLVIQLIAVLIADTVALLPLHAHRGFARLAVVNHSLLAPNVHCSTDELLGRLTSTKGLRPALCAWPALLNGSPRV